MKKKTKTQNTSYSQEFRETAVRLALSGEKSIAAVAKELGLPEWKLYAWVDAFRKRQAKTGDNAAPAAEQIAKLQKELKQLKEENEILKKAAAYFAKTVK